MRGVWPWFRTATMSVISSMTCLTVTTEWAWSQRRGNSDDADFRFCLEAWRADQVMFTAPLVFSVTTVILQNICTGLYVFWDDCPQKNSWWDLDPPTHFHVCFLCTAPKETGACNYCITMWSRRILSCKEGRANIGKDVGFDFIAEIFIERIFWVILNVQIRFLDFPKYIILDQDHPSTGKVDTFCLRTLLYPHRTLR